MALVNAWLTPFAITIGVIALAICATIAAISLTVEVGSTASYTGGQPQIGQA